MQPTNRREPGLSGYWTVVRKRWALVLVPVLVFVGLASVYSLNEPDRYESTAMVFVARTSNGMLPTAEELGFMAKELADEVSLAESDAVVGRVVAELGEIPEVRVDPVVESDVLIFTGSASGAEDAALYANTWAEAYIQVKRDLRASEIAAATVSLQARLVELDEERRRLEGSPVQLDSVAREAEAAVTSLAELELQAELSRTGEARLVQIAAPPTERSNAPLSRNIALGLGVGLLAGLCLVPFAESRSKTTGSSVDSTRSLCGNDSGEQEALDLASISRRWQGPRRGIDRWLGSLRNQPT